MIRKITVCFAVLLFVLNVTKYLVKEKYKR